MEILFLLFVGVIFLLIGLGVLMRLFTILEVFFAPLWDFILYLRYQYFPVTIPAHLINTLSQHFDYYIELNDRNKRRFEKRVLLFLKSKKFIPRNDIVLTENMMVLIGACAVQLTFGLSFYRLRYFHKIFLYPHSYQYQKNRPKFRGHVSDYGSIHLSWDHFERGYLFPDDGINLGLHEMAHAVKLHATEKIVNFEFYDHHETWQQLAKMEMKKIRHTKKHLLRKYAGRNIEEMWAVSVECFFELPDEFEDKLPKLFQGMKDILKQDPRNKSNPILEYNSELAYSN